MTATRCPASGARCLRAGILLRTNSGGNFRPKAPGRISCAAVAGLSIDDTASRRPSDKSSARVESGEARGGEADEGWRRSRTTGLTTPTLSVRAGPAQPEGRRSRPEVVRVGLCRQQPCASVGSTYSASVEGDGSRRFLVRHSLGTGWRPGLILRRVLDTYGEASRARHSMACARSRHMP